MAQADFRDRLLDGLGGEWPEPCDLNVRVRETIRKDGYRIESLYYDAEPNDPIPAMLLVPDGVTSKTPAPGIAIWHQHNGQYRPFVHPPQSLPQSVDFRMLRPPCNR